MSRQERDARVSRGRRLHSRFDREPSPKKLRRDEKPGVDRVPSSHHHSSVVEKSNHEQKRQRPQDVVPLEIPPASSTAVLLNEKKSLEGKGDRPSLDNPHSSDLREVSRSRKYYQHDERGSAGQGGRNYGRRIAGDLDPSLPFRYHIFPTVLAAALMSIAADHGRWSDSKEQSRNRFRDETYDQLKKDDKSQSHADEKTSIWRHDRFYELESGVPPARKRPAFREKKIIAEPEGDADLMVSDKTKLSTSVPPEPATAKRDERGGFYPQALDKPDRTFTRIDDGRERRGDGFYQRGEIHRNVNQLSDRYGGMRGRGDRFNTRYVERDSSRAGGFEVEKWKHDLFDEANKSPPPKNEEEQIAKVEALLAL